MTERDTFKPLELMPGRYERDSYQTVCDELRQRLIIARALSDVLMLNLSTEIDKLLERIPTRG